MGGRSPLNDLTRRQAEGLRAALAAEGRTVPVWVGMRNWHPFLHETLAEMKDRGCRRALGIILSSLQTEASWSRYVEDVAAAREKVGPDSPEVVYAPPWSEHPRFVEAMADRARAALAGIAPARPAAARLVFTAPSVPMSMGAGSPSGLAAAHRAVELARERGRPLELTLLEGADRLGGTIQTERRDGFLVECGPDSFLSEKPWALALCRRLGVEDRLIGTDNRFRRVFVAFRGRLHPLPDGFQLLAPTQLRSFLASSLFSWSGKLPMACDLVLPRGRSPDESLGAFVRRRLGRAARARVAQPLVGGIYTADPDELSLGATMPRFLEMGRRG